MPDNAFINCQVQSGEPVQFRRGDIVPPWLLRADPPHLVMQFSVDAAVANEWRADRLVFVVRPTEALPPGGQIIVCKGRGETLTVWGDVVFEGVDVPFASTPPSLWRRARWKAQEARWWVRDQRRRLARKVSR